MSSRRKFLKNSAVSAIAAASSNVFAQGAQPSQKVIAQVEALEAQKDIASTANWDDGLAHPIPYQNPLGKGKARGIALGGGGTPLIAWYAGYFNALRKNGVDLSNADIVVGTSAGSLFGAMLTGGRLWMIIDEMDFFKDFPKLFVDLIPAVQFNDAQKRAIEASTSALDATPASIQRIGKAAMASRNPQGEAKYYKVTELILGGSSWPSPVLHTTANDCFTGQRLVVSQSSGVPINVACAASSSLPGQLGPTFVKDRLCMDGGICQTSVHSDVIVGVKKALVISLGDGTQNEKIQGLRTSSLPDILNQEVRALEASGTQTKHIVVGLPPGISKVENLVDPKWIASYLQYGWDRGVADAPMMKAFWS
jgi:NTE family protein